VQRRSTFAAKFRHHMLAGREGLVKQRSFSELRGASMHQRLKLSCDGPPAHGSSWLAQHSPCKTLHAMSATPIRNEGSDSSKASSQQQHAAVGK
jgi:hypothetical protein